MSNNAAESFRCEQFAQDVCYVVQNHPVLVAHVKRRLAFMYNVAERPDSSRSRRSRRENFRGGRARRHTACAQSVDMFPGAIVCSLERRDMHKLAKPNAYVALEKTDGVRYLLLLTSLRVHPDDSQREPYAVLIDRKMQMRIVLLDFPAHLYTEEVLFDGELAQNVDNGLHTFLIFDLIFSGNKPNDPSQKALTRQTFYTNRMRHANQLLRNYWRKHINTAAEYDAYGDSATAANERNGTVKNTFALKVKRYVPMRNFEQSYANVCHSGAWVHCGFNIDGFIFVPSRQLVEPFRNREQYKWKPREKHTIDLQLLPRLKNNSSSSGRTDQYDLFAKSSRNTPQLFVELPLCPENNAFVTSHLVIMEQFFRNHQNFIVECTYDPYRNLWLLAQQRTDKHTPNAMHTIERTVRNIEEDIKLQEIVDLSRSLTVQRPFDSAVYRSVQPRNPNPSTQNFAASQDRTVVDAPVAGAFVHPSRQQFFSETLPLRRSTSSMQTVAKMPLPCMFSRDTHDGSNCGCVYCLYSKSNKDGSSTPTTLVANTVPKYDPETNWQTDAAGATNMPRVKAEQLETYFKSTEAAQAHQCAVDTVPNAENPLIGASDGSASISEMLSQLSATLSQHEFRQQQ